MKTSALAFTLSVLGMHGLAAAQTATVAPPPPGMAAVAPPPEHSATPRAGVELAVLPIGSLGASVGNASTRVDSAAAFGVGGVLQLPIGAVFALDLAPRVLFNVKGSDDDSSATELDVRARVTAGSLVSPGVRIFAALEPGFSVLFLPNSTSTSPSPKGLILGFGAGAAVRVAPALWLTGELGYQIGFQSMTVTNIEVGLDTRFFHLTGGVLFDL
jgi:hypothetical protein